MDSPSTNVTMAFFQSDRRPLTPRKLLALPLTRKAGGRWSALFTHGRFGACGGGGTQSLIRLARGQTPPEVSSVDVGHHIDNVRWAPDGSLLAAGHVGETQASIMQCLGQGRGCDSVRSMVTRVDPERLTAREIIRYPSNDLLILGTVAIEVGGEIWVGGIAGGTRIARFTLR